MTERASLVTRTPVLSLGAAIRRRRRENGLTQQDVVDALRGLHVPLSRSHLANIERARFRPTGHVLAALDSLLGLEGVSFNPSDEMPPDCGVATYSESDVAAAGILQQWDSFARDLSPQESLPTERSVFLMRPPSVGSRVIEGASALKGRAEIFAAAISLLKQANLQTTVNGTIQISGAVSEWLGEEPETWRSLLIGAMKGGWRVEQTFPSCADLGSSGSEWLRMAGSLIACSRYRARIVEEPSGGLLVVTGPILMAMQLLDGAASATAFVHSDPKLVTALFEHQSERNRSGKPLAEPILRRSGPTEDSWSLAETKKARLLTERSRQGTWSGYSLGWIPSNLIPPDIFAVKARQRGARAGFDDVAEHLVVQQEERHRNILTSLRSHPCRIVVPESCLTAFAEEGSYRYATTKSVKEWRVYSVEERLTVLRWLLELSDRENFELALTSDASLSRAVTRHAFSVRGGTGGFVLLRTPAREGDQELEVDIFIDDPNAVMAYGLLFERVFGRVSRAQHTPTSEVLHRLVTELARSNNSP